MQAIGVVDLTRILVLVCHDENTIVFFSFYKAQTYVIVKDRSIKIRIESATIQIGRNLKKNKKKQRT